MSYNDPTAPPPTYNAATGNPGYTGYSDPNTGAGYGAVPQPTGYAPPPAGYAPPPAGYAPPPAGYAPPPTGYAPPPAGYVSPEQPMYEPKDDSSVEFADAGFARSSFSDKAIRRAFIKKVYLILMAQLVVTFGIVCLFTFVEPVYRFVQKHSWLYFISYALFIVLYIVLVCVREVRRKYPINFICLGIFTLVFSYMVGTIASYYNTESVLIAAGITAAVCLAISLFAIQTKIDFTLCSGLLFALVMVLILFGFSVMMMYLIRPYDYFSRYVLHCVWGGLAALVFSLFLIFDTQLIMGGRKFTLSPEEYVFGALQLYLDIVYLFLIILSIFGGGKK